MEILLEAAVRSEMDHLKGITDNIIMGQLVPYGGTGSFEVVIDEQVLGNHVQWKPEDWEKRRHRVQQENLKDRAMAENFFRYFLSL